jgi:hypothetical protein
LLKATISNNKKLKIDIRVGVIPSCYNNKEKVALVECCSRLPAFLLKLKANLLAE